MGKALNIVIIKTIIILILELCEIAFLASYGVSIEKVLYKN